MKIFNNIRKTHVWCLAMAMLAMGCSDSFLDEECISTPSTDYLKTEQGIEELVIGTYQKLKFKFNYTWGIHLYNMGVDEFTDANNTSPHYNQYTTSLNSDETGSLSPVWDNYYGTVEPANIIIENVQQYISPSASKYNTRLGEGYFFRAYAYFELVKQFGGVPLKLQSSTGVETYFTRNSEEEVYAQVIADFEQAYNLLPEKPETTGRLTKMAAAHFLAKAKLFRASELHDGWNAKYKEQDLKDVITYGTQVVEAHPLCNDFVELWDYQKANGANESVSEVVLAAQFSDDTQTWGRFGNQMHLYYPSVYQDMAGTKRDISGDREFSYVSATEYTMQVFDRVNDSRFWKSFITCYGCNDPKVSFTWSIVEGATLPAGAVEGENRIQPGDIAIKYIVNNPGDTRYTYVGEAKDKAGNCDNVLKNGVLTPTHTFVRYFSGETFNWATDITNLPGNYYGVIPHKRSVALSKFRDGYRNAIASQFGTRDAIIARSADDVLMVAEAYARQGKYDEAITWINKLRERAGYAAGEDRAHHVDGGQAYKNNSYCAGKGGGYNDAGAIFVDQNTYFESNDLEGQEDAVNATESKTAMKLASLADIVNSPVDAPIYEALGLTSDADKVLAFILNERTRELIGESHRWEDLARTKTLDARWYAFNDSQSRGGAFDPQKHYYRPIPQSFLDGITNASGAALSDEEKSAMQNPGY